MLFMGGGNECRTPGHVTGSNNTAHNISYLSKRTHNFKKNKSMHNLMILLSK